MILFYNLNFTNYLTFYNKYFSGRDLNKAYIDSDEIRTLQEYRKIFMKHVIQKNEEKRGNLINKGLHKYFKDINDSSVEKEIIYIVLKNYKDYINNSSNAPSIINLELIYQDELYHINGSEKVDVEELLQSCVSHENITEEYELRKNKNRPHLILFDNNLLQNKLEEIYDSLKIEEGMWIYEKLLKKESDSNGKTKYIYYFNMFRKVGLAFNIAQLKDDSVFRKVAENIIDDMKDVAENTTDDMQDNKKSLYTRYFDEFIKEKIGYKLEKTQDPKKRAQLEELLDKSFNYNKEFKKYLVTCKNNKSFLDKKRKYKSNMTEASLKKIFKEEVLRPRYKTQYEEDAILKKIIYLKNIFKEILNTLFFPELYVSPIERDEYIAAKVDTYEQKVKEKWDERKNIKIDNACYDF